MAAIAHLTVAMELTIYHCVGAYDSWEVKVIPAVEISKEDILQQ